MNKMKLFDNQLVQKIIGFIKRHIVKIVIIGAVVSGISGFTGMIVYNESTSFCLKCHYKKGQFVAIDMNTPAHKNIGKGAPGCMSCHPDKAVEKWALRGVTKAKILSQRVANLRFTEATTPRQFYTSEECLKCHPGRLDVVDREPYLLDSEKLREIGLRFNKRLHYRFEKFHVEDQKLYQELKSKQALSKDEQEELNLLEKIKLGNCGQCHLREKYDAAGNKIVDKTVNFKARNPITCEGCHENVTPLNHPGQPLAMPSEESCQKCHHGKIHGKFVIFRAECEDLTHTENCIKCHPNYEASKKNIIVSRKFF